jgi:uncharacterized protein (TIGR02147 family)
MSESLPNYRKFLMDEFTRRQQRNAAYSWRAFARDLKVTASRISEVMSGKAGISVERARSFADRLSLSEDDRKIFIDLVEMEHGRNSFGRQLARERLEKRLGPWPQIATEAFSSFSEWYYIPLMVLLDTQLASYTPAYLGRRLGLSESEAEAALTKLHQLRLIEQRGEALVPTEAFYKTQVGSSDTRRRYLKQLFKKAEDALDTQPLEKRSFTSTVMAVDPAQIKMVQGKIREFCRELMKELDEAPKKTSVYCVSVNLFEMTVE